MNTSALKWASCQKLRSGVATNLLLALARRANQAGECWPSQATLAAETGYSIRAVRAAMQALDRWGLISRQKRGSNKNRGGRSSDLVRLSMSGNSLSAGQAVGGSVYRKKSAGKEALVSGRNLPLSGGELAEGIQPLSGGGS
ncbi:helix-turn-helix domain-containing protein [Microvirga tunisiensis]|uniref:Helix-turn-helix domain-containing protein n=1 Tax=Microvirga tunisiensis TaxID=2108360 RepID=A0A5N7MSZ2_9HYPH|nr:helix-turn-helix domain-containing protein [Microvirga tunisiensis]MPR12169.1 helix-turn-helix domain-containing protein [Microvirga tunisiensis]MPR30115.1 helix-turn-helix domain-containing protein [Microvirga tunisiensis]